MAVYINTNFVTEHTAYASVADNDAIQPWWPAHDSGVQGGWGLSFWFKMNNADFTAGYRPNIIKKTKNHTSPYIYGEGINVMAHLNGDAWQGGKLRLRVADDIGTDVTGNYDDTFSMFSTTSVLDNVWRHVFISGARVSQTTCTVKLYINGILEATTTNVSTMHQILATGESLIISNNAAPAVKDQWYKGGLADIRFYRWTDNSALDFGRYLASYRKFFLPDNLSKATFPLWENTSTYIRDISSSNLVSGAFTESAYMYWTPEPPRLLKGI